MKWKASAVLVLMATLSVTMCLGQGEAVMREVEALMREIASSEEGLADPGARARLQKAMSDGGDWDNALLRLLDPNRYDQHVIGPAISVLHLRGRFERPEVQAAVAAYFKARVKAAREHSRSDELFVPVVRGQIRGLASGFAKSGGPDLLLAVLDEATSMEERADPLLDEYNRATIAEALLEKGDSRHLEGMRMLLTITNDVAVKEKLERAIAVVETTQPKATPKPSTPRALTPPTPVPTATPSPATRIAKAAESPAQVVEHKSPVWPWLLGILALVAVVAFALRWHAQLRRR